MAHLELRQSMAGPFVCEKLEVLPTFLYHIEHANSQADHSGPNIEAADPTPGPLTWSELEKRAQEHRDWYNKRPSCFVSAFKGFKHAHNWGRQQTSKGPVYMYTIDTRRLPRSGPMIIVLRMPNSQEYLFLGQIPNKVIVDKEQIWPRKRFQPAEPKRKCRALIISPSNPPHDGSACLGVWVQS